MTELRKQKLLEEGAYYRSKIQGAKNSVQDSLEKLFVKRIGGRLLTMAYSILKNRANLAGVNIQTVAPFVLSGITAFSKKVRVKPIIRTALVLTAVSTVAVLLIKKTKKPTA